MWYSNILVAYDGSQPSRKALRIAKEFAEENPCAKLLFAHVVKLFGSPETDARATKALLENAHEIEAELQQFADGLPNVTEVRLLKGTSPSEMLLRCARDEHCDLIIMGSRGQGGVKGYLGSVSYAVTQQARACVLIAKDNESA